MLGLPASSGFGANPLPLAQSASYIPPALLFVLAVVAAIGLILLLPGRMEGPLRKIGAIVLLAAGLVFAALVAKTAGGMDVYFWVFAAIAVLGAVRVITHSKPVYSALYFVLTVMATAGLFVLMWAEFMAAALILIYAGAILVTYVFVIMLAAEAQPETVAGPGGAMHEQLAEHDAISREPIIASAVGFALLGIILFVIFDKATPLQQRADVAPTPATTQPTGFVPRGGTQQLGNYLFNKQLINLELAGLILTVAMVGAIVIARKRVVIPGRDTARETTAAGETVLGPATPVDDNPHSIPVYGTDNPRQKEYPET
ncbi:MAG: NADH-quinone oxidoreductase subunit [Phycisphaerales bacterium]|nr:NADH-quinone oxidoreductase subunit [Phycisphaerales bacterium]